MIIIILILVLVLLLLFTHLFNVSIVHKSDDGLQLFHLDVNWIVVLTEEHLSNIDKTPVELSSCVIRYVNHFGTILNENIV